MGLKFDIIPEEDFSYREKEKGKTPEV